MIDLPLACLQGGNATDKERRLQMIECSDTTWLTRRGSSTTPSPSSSTSSASGINLFILIGRCLKSECVVPLKMIELHN